LENAPLFRLEVTPSPENGLEKLCQIMMDKITTVRKHKVREVIGRLDEDTMIRVNRSLALWLGLG
jgi:mRNA interferase MazF